MSDFDFDGKEANHYAQIYIECRMARADVIRCLEIEGADKDEATEFVDAIYSEAVSG